MFCIPAVVTFVHWLYNLCALAADSTRARELRWTIAVIGINRLIQHIYAISECVWWGDWALVQGVTNWHFQWNSSSATSMRDFEFSAENNNNLLKTRQMICFLCVECVNSFGVADDRAPQIVNYPPYVVFVSVNVNTFCVTIDTDRGPWETLCIVLFLWISIVSSSRAQPTTCVCVCVCLYVLGEK